MLQIYFKTGDEWRQWLEANNNAEKEVWLIFYKKNSGVQCVSYDEAVCEALCFGWIDSLARSVDEEKYIQKFTPRNPKSDWSDLNKKRVIRLIDAGKMTNAGMQLIKFDLEQAKEELAMPKTKEYIKLPEQYMKILARDEAAFAYYNKIPPSHRHEYANYIMDAKKEETRLRRLGRVIETLRAEKHKLF